MDEATTSSSFLRNVEFDQEFIRRARHMSLSALKKELEALENNQHPLLSTKRRKIEKERLLDMDRIKSHREMAELKAKTDFARRGEEATSEYNRRIAELREEAQKRSEELERTVYHEYGSIDITKPMVVPLVVESNKKTLRGRGGGQLIEPVTYFNSNPGNRVPEIKYKLAFDDSRIRKDLNAILNRTGESSRRRQIYQVSIQKPKLMIENKSFKQGEDVLAHNKTFGNMLAKLDIVNDKLIQLKGVMTWDTRQISATIGDLEEGRVTISKQRAKDRGAQ